MTAGVESVDTIDWARVLLQGDSAWVAATPGGAHLGVGPIGSAAPVCTLWVQSSSEYLTAFYQRVWTDATLMVKHSGPQESFALVRTAAAEARRVLHRATGGAQGSIIIACVLTQSFPLPELQLVNGVQWISLVQLYRVQVQ